MGFSRRFRRKRTVEARRRRSKVRLGPGELIHYWPFGDRTFRHRYDHAPIHTNPPAGAPPDPLPVLRRRAVRIAAVVVIGFAIFTLMAWAAGR